MTISYSTLFTRLGKCFFAQDTVNANRAPTTSGAFPKELNDYLIEFDNVSTDLQAVIDGAAPAVAGGQNGLSPVTQWLQQSAQKLVIQMVKDDNPQADATLTTALKELIRQMTGSSESVDASTVGASASAGGSNNGNGVCVVTTKRGDGLVNENIIAETVTITCTSDQTEGQEVFTAKGQASVPSLSQDWPKGSGATASITAVNAASGSPNLISNGSFEDEDDRANFPDDWELLVGTIGTTLKITDPEVQTIVVSGPPTAGTYTITYTNPSSKVQTTIPLAYDAGQSAVQSALRSLVGLEDVEVVTTGSSPLYTHTIYFYGADNGNLTQLTSTNSTTGGTYTHATTTTGSAYVFKGAKALQFVGDGSQLTSLAFKLTNLTALQQLAFNGWFMTDSAPAAGSMRVDLWDGSAVINDQQGVANSLTIDPTALTGSYVAYNTVFRLPRILPPIVYLRIRVSTAITNTKNVFVDHVALRETQALYAGGPELAIFSGSTASRFRKGSDQVAADYFSLAVTNNRAGLFQEHFDRNFDMKSKGLLLPSNTGGTETQADSLVS